MWSKGGDIAGDDPEGLTLLTDGGCFKPTEKGNPGEGGCLEGKIFCFRCLEFEVFNGNSHEMLKILDIGRLAASGNLVIVWEMYIIAHGEEGERC